MATIDIQELSGSVKARVFWEHVIHPRDDVVIDMATGEVTSKPRLDERGREILSRVPVEVPLPFDRPEPLHLRIRRMVLEAMSQKAQDEGYETMADFEDFGEDDDSLPLSPYERDIDNLDIDTDIGNNEPMQQSESTPTDTSIEQNTQ